jgi:hypothetical protein
MPTHAIIRNMVVFEASATEYACILEISMQEYACAQMSELWNMLILG